MISDVTMIIDYGLHMWFETFWYWFFMILSEWNFFPTQSDNFPYICDRKKEDKFNSFQFKAKTVKLRRFLYHFYICISFYIKSHTFLIDFFPFCAFFALFSFSHCVSFRFVCLSSLFFNLYLITWNPATWLIYCWQRNLIWLE